MDEPDSAGAAAGWARLPRWQHVVLIVLCIGGLIAGIANFLIADTNRARVFHAIFTVADAALLVFLISGYLARGRQ
jgi:phage shock protein PspC (stress-responsive transcriptional regulator)